MSNELSHWTNPTCKSRDHFLVVFVVFFFFKSLFLVHLASKKWVRCWQVSKETSVRWKHVSPPPHGDVLKWCLMAWCWFLLLFVSRWPQAWDSRSRDTETTNQMWALIVPSVSTTSAISAHLVFRLVRRIGSTWRRLFWCDTLPSFNISYTATIKWEPVQESGHLHKHLKPWHGPKSDCWSILVKLK